ncbi:unnamed protein product [Cylicocyclus nassatus]|uniref:Uncharacterized protein n=1 Tax=Cylicocyclus nassatus TaxID=53992 RepID=A0AA36DJS4_CYLNA|nr:unnamed protein product [Cylicocyclus nassatus]
MEELFGHLKSQVDHADETVHDRNPSYFKHIVNSGTSGVLPCTFKYVMDKVQEHPASFTATPLLWITLIVALAYSRHRTRAYLAEASLYDRQSFIKQWFEQQQAEEKQKGVHPIDATVRDCDFRYDDVKVTTDDFKAISFPPNYGEPRLCSIHRPFSVEMLEIKKKEFRAFVARAYLNGTNNPVTRQICRAYVGGLTYVTL